MSKSKVRIGIIGAGANTRSKHIPYLQKIDAVEIIAVCNRSRESGERVAREFNIPKVMNRWSDVVDLDEIDAIVIGTWPYLHCEVTCAALDARKHVLCEARMAMNAQEAHRMLEKLKASDCKAMIVPSPMCLKGDYVMRELISDGYLGEVYEIYARGLSSTFADPHAPLHWRQRYDLSGMNVLTLGIFNETVQRFFGDTASLIAQARLFISKRKDAESGEMRDVDIPDSLSVIAEMTSGAQAIYHLSGVARFAGNARIEAYGSDGTLHYDISTDRIFGAKASEDELTEIDIPREKERHWTVEEDFIAAIREDRPITLTSFEDGVKYMEFTEAVSRSADTGRRVTLPLSG